MKPVKHSEKGISSWLMGKKFYIVLLCCIMLVSVTYLALWTTSGTKMASVQVAAIPSIKPISTVMPKLEEVVAVNPITQPKIAETPQKKPAVTAAPKLAEADIPAPTPESEPAPKPKNKLELPVSGTVLNDYTADALTYSKTLGDWRVHSGIDIKAEIGSSVKAGDDGIIEDVLVDDQMGIIIIIDHQNGLKSVYSNLSTGDLVKVGDSVSKGDIISGVGDTALLETGEVGHLHFEMIEDGKDVDPKIWLII